jgi:hypothetical protein
MTSKRQGARPYDRAAISTKRCDGQDAVIAVIDARLLLLMQT